MVAARKVPVAPVPPTSRSNSTQPLPRRTAKQKSTPREPTPPSSGNESKAPSQPNGVQTTPQKKEAPSTWSKQLFLFLLSIFAVYAATVCRSDNALSSPVCRGLATYRTHVLEPYLIPPIRTYLVPPVQAAIHHPALVPLHPYAHSVSAAVRPRVSAAASFAKAKYDAHVLPAATAFWEDKLYPIYKTYLYPQVRPYILIYHNHLLPAYNTAHTHVEPYVERAKPHIHATYVAARKYSCAAYAAAKLQALAAYAKLRPHAIVFYHQAKAHAVQCLAKAAEARREFVDPHVRRIWDKVGEAEATGAATTSTVVAQSKATSTQDEPASASSVIQASVAAESGIAADVASSAAEAASSAASSPPATTIPVSSSAAAPPPPATASSLAAAAASAASSSEEAAASPAPAQETPPPEASQTPIPTITTHTESETAASAASIIAASLHVTADSAQEPLHRDAEEIDDFLRDIGLGGTPASATEQEPAATEPAVAEPDPEELRAATAERRADIVGRHEAWQAKLDALITEREGTFRGALDEFRKGAVKELGGMYAADKGVVGNVETEAGRLMKGLEGYLQKLKAKTSVDEEEKETWGKVVGKVEERFTEKVRNVQGEVHEWYLGVREGEGREVLRAAAEVKALADKAQADIGLDYAWLDDVTYHDWQKYHDLMRASERFATTLQTIQNGTHVDPQRDVLLEALDVLETEMQEVISGFLVRLQAIHREAKEDVFSPVPPPSPPKDEEEEPRVSILPIEPEPQVKPAEGAEHLFVGKDPEAVARALESVEVEEKKAADHVEL